MPPKRATGRRTQLVATSSPAKEILQSALPLFFPVIYPPLFAFFLTFKESPRMAASRNYPYKPKGASTTDLESSIEPSVAGKSSPRSRSAQLFINAAARPNACESEASIPSIGRSLANALAQAYSCNHRRRSPHHHLTLSRHAYSYHKTRRRGSHLIRGHQVRSMQSMALNTRPSLPIRPTYDELINLVDTYPRGIHSMQVQSTEPFPAPQMPYLGSFTASPQMASIPGPIPEPIFPEPQEHLSVQSTASTSEDAHIECETIQEHTQEQNVIDEQNQTLPNIAPKSREDPHLQEVIHVLRDTKCTHDQAFEAYSRLPSPGVSFLKESQIRTLFSRLSALEKKDKKSAFQYLSVVDDMKTAGIPLTQSEWNSAIAFCGQCYSHIRDEHVEKAIGSWRQMEQEGGIEAGVVTFNILFDMAAKSGKFVLGEMVLTEMELRGLEPNRYSRVSKIYFYGLRKDGDGVRQAYRELVDAGEIVDTVVMNCVIAALIAAGEVASAESVYGRMKEMLATRTGDKHLSITDWRESRALGRLFDHLAQGNRCRREDHHVPIREVLKQHVTIVPNLHTYAIFIDHHAVQTGNLRRIAVLIGEMTSLDISIHGRIFLKLFKGFASHGARPYTDWTLERLRKVYESLLIALDERADEVKVQPWLVIWAVRAFEKCSGREAARQVWDELRTLWQPNDEEVSHAFKRLGKILETKATGGLASKEEKTINVTSSAV